MRFDRVGTEILRDNVKSILHRVTEEDTAVVLTRYGREIAALVPVSFLRLVEEVDLMGEGVRAQDRAYFLDGHGRCVKCGREAPVGDVPLFGSWHLPDCSRFRP